MKIKRTFAQYMFKTRNILLERIFGKMIDEIRPNGWMKHHGKYLGEFGMSLSHLKTISGEDVGGAVNRWERDRWRSEVECKVRHAPAV